MADAENPIRPESLRSITRRHFFEQASFGIGGIALASLIDRAVSASADELRKARVAAVLQAFMIGAALLVGAAIAWFSAVEGGKDRAESRFPSLGRRVTIRIV